MVIVATPAASACDYASVMLMLTTAAGGCCMTATGCSIKSFGGEAALGVNTT
jgi:hypothetical protein